MLITKLFYKPQWSPSKDNSIRSYQYLIMGNYIKYCCAGVYTWMPLGLMLIRNITKIIDTEMAKSDFIEVLMPCIQDADIWCKSNRYNLYGKELLKFNDRNNKPLVFAPTHEEVATIVFNQNIISYKQLPVVFYHNSWKFRDEIRPKNGLMRCREFLMHDAYSFDVSVDEAMITYQKIFSTYLRIFKKIGVAVIPVKADSGIIGGTINHEFHIPADDGESRIMYNTKIVSLIKDQDVVTFDDVQDSIGKALEENIGNNQTLDETASNNHYNNELETNSENIITRSIEIGHIFYFGDKYSKVLDVKINYMNNESLHPKMGSYGIGISRLVAAIIESSSTNDHAKIYWPYSIAPFKIQIIPINYSDIAMKECADKIYLILKAEITKEILLDDRLDIGIGAKFNHADLISAPIRVIVGKKFIKDNILEIQDISLTHQKESCLSSLVNDIRYIIQSISN